MANTVTISGQLTAGQQLACDGGFPAGVLQVGFGLVGGCPGTKSAPVQSYHTKQINSPSAFVALDGIGSAESVTQCNTLYVRVTSPMTLRFTTKANSGPDVVAVVPIQGIGVWEFPVTNYLLLLEIMGTGPVEYYVSGNQ